MSVFASLTNKIGTCMEKLKKNKKKKWEGRNETKKKKWDGGKEADTRRHHYPP